MELIINRTLVYAALTGVLASIDIGSILVLQALFRALTRQESDLAIIISTLAIAVRVGRSRSHS